ncbi:FRAS1- extracellular matrix protein 2 [Ameca splendens]|uniref:FRAS1- extracellular matrix protein 2 n=1 Tax=Ameca splendens TaxID=208324 RepID=A0ABV0ZFJ7_9TELE
MCLPRKMGTVGAEPFSAKLHYTGTDDLKHPNLIKVTITMPHIDGMLPVISTRPLTNFDLTLSPDGTRVGNHRCSNLLDFSEVTTGHGFITASIQSPESIGESASYQFSSSLRGNSTLRFYKNLNLEACLWEFRSYYHMSELLTDCGGTIGTNGQVCIAFVRNIFLNPMKELCVCLVDFYLCADFCPVYAQFVYRRLNEEAAQT